MFYKKHPKFYYKIFIEATKSHFESKKLRKHSSFEIPRVEMFVLTETFLSYRNAQETFATANSTLFYCSSVLNINLKLPTWMVTQFD